MQVQKNKIVPVSLLGPSNVGKTTFINFVHHGEFIRSHATMGSDYSNYTFQQNKTLQFWDNPGINRSRHIVLEMNKRFKIFLFVFDLSDGSSFSQVQQWLAQLQQRVPLDKIIAYAFGNKSDLPRMIQRDFIQSFWAQKGIQYNEISFINNGNTKKVIDRVIREIWSQNAYLQIQQQNQHKKSIRLQQPLNEKEIKSKRKCC